jgi:periplasmic glucans biosynthesis protein
LKPRQAWRVAATVVVALAWAPFIGACESPSSSRSLAAGAAGAATTSDAARDGAARPAARFTAAQVEQLARELAAAPHRAAGEIPAELAKLDYDQYRKMRFRRDYALWPRDRSGFRLELLPAGFIYAAPVQVSLVEDGAARELAPRPDMFEVDLDLPASLQRAALPASGFRLLTRINSPQKWDEFVVFQGASYFRAVGRGQDYGLSARGLALRTAQPEGEEFPAFTRFWIERPAPGARSILVHALLESESVTGAYHFEIQPGRDTTMDVRFTLFPRVALRHVGLAPLTSMFLFDATNRSRFEDIRNRVHDSDGLLIHTRADERIWRHLANPRELQLSSFTTEAPRGFGLIQRARLLADYQDLEARYERRPSVWVEPGAGFDAGPVRLVEIPTPRETNDNIVAFWQPDATLPAGQPFEGSYRLVWTADTLLEHPVGTVVASRIGKTPDGNRKLFVLDLAGVGESPEDYALDVGASAGTISNPVLQVNPAVRGLRATFELDTGNASLIELRAQLRRDGQAASEIWLYRWTPG